MKASTWSKIGIAWVVFAAALFATGAEAQQVVINEIHYNPSSSDDLEEFLELHNPGPVAVDISGWKLAYFLTTGDSFTFPPGTSIPAGGFAVVALNPTQLLARTGCATPFAWPSTSNLSNGGEPVGLLDAGNNVVDSLTYDDVAPWPTAPDGGGPSLELTNPLLDNSLGASWAASTGTNGTCNAVNSTYSAEPTVVSEIPVRGSLITALTEVSVTFSGAVTGVTAGDMVVDGTPASGVTGSGAGPYVFTVTPSAARTVEVVLNAGSIQGAGGFAFAGDSWEYYFDYPKIVINEFHYHPSDAAVDIGAGEDPENLQFLELYNADTETIDLSGWGTVGIAHTFAAGTTLDPGGYLVMAKDPTFLQSKVTIPGGVQVVAWTSGDLSNGGETIALTDPYANAIDTLTYSDGGAWPGVADGDGPSLELIHPELPNEYSASWRASLVTNGTPGAQNGVYETDPAPIVFDTTQVPTRPTGNQAVTVTTSAFARGGAAPTLTLYHRQDADPKLTYASIPMFDDGLHGDGAAGDGRYGAILAGLPSGNQLDFYIEASDGTRSAEAPAGHATLNKYGEPSQTYLMKFSNEVLPTDFPVYQILVTLTNKRHQEALTGELDRREQFDCTFIDGDGNLWYNLTERYRGQSSILRIPSSYRVDFPTDRPLQSPMGFPVTVLQLNSMSPMRQWLGFDLFNRAGVHGPKTAWIHLRYPGINYDSCCNGQNGYYGMHIMVEKVDEDFVGGQGGVVPRGLSEDGNLYRGQNDGDLRWEGWNPDAYRADVNDRNGYTKENNSGADLWDDLINLCDALNNTPANQYASHVGTHIDEDNWARFFAIHNLLGNKEGGIYRDTGDDYFIYFNPLPGGDNARMIPWDTDSVISSSHETIWRTNVASVRNVIRHNAFAPIFVKELEDLMANEYSAATMNAVIDAMPNVFATAGCSDIDPCTKQQFKNWIAAQSAAFQAEIKDDLTLIGVPSSPYTNADPVIAIGGDLGQAGTHNVTVNGAPATFSVYAGTWSHNLTLAPGMNTVLVQAWDRTGGERDRIEQTVFYNPPGSQQLLVTMRAPRWMVNTKTLTIEAKITDAIGRPDYTRWDVLGTVSVRRVSDGTTVPVTMTVFDPHVAVTNGTIRIVNGWGSVSFTLDAGAAFGAGDIEVSVSWSGLSDSQVVTVLDNPPYRALQGTLSGADLVWGPDEVIRVTGNTTINGGDTLTVNPGTLVWVDTTGSLENGTLFTVNGSIRAVGTRDNPIYFFSDRGPAAMSLTQSGSASNPECWRGLFHYGSATSRYEHVFLTGAGNGPVTGHPRPPILSFQNTHSFVAKESVFADDNGMVFSTPGTGNFTVTDCLVNRVGIGGEFMSSGHTLTVRNTWWISNGYAPEANNLDGDHLHIDGAGSTQLIQGCIFNDGGDDAVDHNGSNFTILDSIISHTDDKAISMTGGHATLRNLLIFGSPQGIRGTASTEYVTINTGLPIATNDIVQKTIVWPSTINTCSGTVSYTDVGDPASLGCGTANLSSDPMFVSTSAHDFNLQAGSPALTAGPDGTRIGWLGFPSGAVCATTADCDDGNPCTFDNCEADRTCSFAPIAGCRTCATALECDDANPCTVDTCGVGGTCDNDAGNDGAACDDGMLCTSPDTCLAGVCEGTEHCPIGQQCNVAGVCSSEPVTLTFQQGIGGYGGTADTYIDTALGSQATVTPIVVDGSPVEQVLLRFDGIFGAGANQIPQGSTVDSAVLTLRVGSGANDQSTNPVNYHRLLHAWTDTDVWAAYGVAPWNATGGVQADGVDAVASVEATATMSTASTAYAVSVVGSVQSWANDPSSNHGWAILPTGTDGLRLESSESTTASFRPMLSVTFSAPVTGCTDSAQCQDGLFCNGVEACENEICVAGTPPSGDDGVACTVDACNETLNACDHAPSNALCDDGNVCTNDLCNAVTGCSRTNNSLACDDGNACTTNDVCAGGVCASAEPTNCDDGLACTIDSCVAPTGCQHADSCPSGQSCNHGSGVCEAGPQTVAFQQGTAGYAGEVDTYISQANPTTFYATTTPIMIDGSPVYQALLRFGEVFVPEGGPIPLGSTIASATVTINVTNVSLDGAELFRMLVPWSDTATWNGMTGGIQTDGVEAAAAYDAKTTSNVLGTWTFDVTSSLAAWSAGAVNHGWAWLPPPAGTDSWQFDSAEGATVANRPLLTVTYLPPITSCTSDPECDDGLWCNGTETCNLGTSTCQAGTPPDCSDGVSCTADSCNEGTNTCEHVAIHAACNDGNVCTDDACDLVNGCFYANNTASCSDDNACTAGDVCSGGACMAGSPVTCDDGVACTDDACNTSAGCEYVSNCSTGFTCNMSSGECEISQVPTLPIAVGDAWKYFKGSVEPSTSWAGLTFDDATWLEGPSGFGYGTDCQAQHGTVLTDMSGGYMSVYMRRQFRVDVPASVGTLTLTVDYDDAFVAYLNGTEVARRNVVGTPPAYNQVATADHECSQCNGTCNPGENIDISAFKSALVPGTNVLAIQAHNLTLASSDFTMTPSMTATTAGCTSDPECDDGLVCNGLETCNLTTSTCQAGTPPTCIDGNACTSDGCDDATGCVYAPLAAGISCSDGLPCNGNETCDGAGACIAGSPPTCGDGNPCTDDSCVDPAGCTHVAVAQGTPCDNGLWCDGSDSCNDTGVCIGDAPPDCEDGVTCTVDTCNETTDACDHAPCAMTVTAIGPRYLAVTPPDTPELLALRVSGPPACVPRYVDAAGLADSATPVYRSSTDWGTVHVLGPLVIPSSVYTVQAEVTAGVPIGSATASTWLWGDADHVNDVDLFDILCVLDGTHGIFDTCTIYGVDLTGPGYTPDGVVDFQDIDAVLEGFQLLPYPDPECSGAGR